MHSVHACVTLCVYVCMCVCVCVSYKQTELTETSLY